MKAQNQPTFPTRYSPVPKVPDKSLRLIGKYVIKGDPTPLPAHVDQLGHALTEGDALADAWIATAATLPRATAQKMFDDALNKGIDTVENPPESLQKLFAQVDHIPMWFDPYLMIKGAESAQRSGIIGELVLSTVSLMGGYLSAGAVKPLMFTGDLTSRAADRVAETTQFVIDVNTPGELTRFGKGFKVAVRVRVMHAMVRRMILSSSKWQTAAWGIPINQGDLVGTNLLFSYTFMMSCRALGMQYSAEERLSIIHLWRYVGYIMGISLDLLPATESEAARLTYLMGITQLNPDKDSASLARALHQVPLNRARTPWQIKKAKLDMSFRTGLSRAILGDDRADQLQLPDSLFKYSLVFLTPVIFTIELCRRLIPGGTRLAFIRGSRWQRNFTHRVTQGKQNTYQPVDELAVAE